MKTFLLFIALAFSTNSHSYLMDLDGTKYPHPTTKTKEKPQSTNIDKNGFETIETISVLEDSHDLHDGCTWSLCVVSTLAGRMDIIRKP